MKLLPSLSRMSRRVGGSRRLQRGFINLALFLPRWGSKRFDPCDLFRAGQQGFVFEPYEPGALVQRRNKATYSEDLSNAAWTKTNTTLGSTITSADNVVLTRVVESAATAAHNISQTDTVSPGKVTISVEAKLAERSFIAVYEGILGKGKFFDLTAGTVGGNLIAAPDSATITSIGGGVYRCEIVVTAAGSSVSPSVYLSTDGATFSYAGDITKGAYVGGLHVENAASISTYQRITDWTTEYLAAALASITEYQDSTGITPVTAVEQSRGMVLDKRLGAVRGADMVANGTFASGLAGWSASGTGGTITNPSGAMLITNGGAAEASAVLDGQTAVAGTWYEVLVDLTARTGGAAGFVVLGSQNLALNGTVGSKRGLVYVVTGGAIRIATGTSTLNDSITVDNVSIRPLIGNHATQSSAASRPVVGARVNLLTNTASAFAGSTNWTSNANITGVLQADGSSLLSRTSTAASSFTAQPSIAGLAVGTDFVVSAQAKKATIGNLFGLRVQGTFPDRADAVLNLDTGAVAYSGSTTYTNVSASASGPDADGFYTITLRARVAGTPAVQVTMGPANTANGTWEATSATLLNCYARSPDLRTAGDAALSIPAYQRVNTASDYDTVGFPVREKYDGLDDYDTTAAGGGSTTGFFYCGAVTVLGGAGTDRVILSDRSGSAGYIVHVGAANQFSFEAGNGTVFSTILGPSADIGPTQIVTCWDDGTNLNLQLNRGAIASIARPVVAAGTASLSEGRSNVAAAGYFNGSLGTRVYRAGPPPDASQRAAIQRYIARRAGVVL